MDLRLCSRAPRMVMLRNSVMEWGLLQNAGDCKGVLVISDE